MKKLGIEFEDIVTDGDGHQWSQVCQDHLEKLESKTDWFSSAPDVCMCGVKGCNKESDYYIDF